MKAMNFAKKKKIWPQEVHSPFSINSTVIEIVDKFEISGVLSDTILNSKWDIDSIACKLTFVIGKIFKVEEYLS